MSITNTPYTVVIGDAGKLKQIVTPDGIVTLDDALPVGFSCKIIKDDDAATPVRVYGDALGIDDYDYVVFTTKGQGAEFIRVDEGWRWLPFGPHQPPIVTLHRTVVAPTPGNSDFIDANINAGKTIRYNCAGGNLMAVLDDPLNIRWGVHNSYRAECTLVVQRVDNDPTKLLTLFVNGNKPISNKVDGIAIPPNGSLILFCDGQMWSIIGSHGIDL